jgi:hypothetical protein
LKYDANGEIRATNNNFGGGGMGGGADGR